LLALPKAGYFFFAGALGGLGARRRGLMLGQGLGVGVGDDFLFLGSEEADAFEVVLAHDVEAEEVGGAGLGAGSGDDGDDLAGADEAALFEQAFGDVDQASVVLTLGQRMGVVPHSRLRRLIVTSTGERAKMGEVGWYLESCRAVTPDSVNRAMPRRSRSSAAWAVASQMVSAMER